MLTPSGRLVFVPLIGSTHTDDWTKVRHSKMWALDDDGYRLNVLYIDGSYAGNYSVGEGINLFEAERKHMVAVKDHESLPDEVCVALARLALDPSTCVRED